jgi:hypothetical protein
LALVPSQAKPGSAEAAIDALVDCRRTPGDAYDPWRTTDERYARVERMGFDAVPALIAHLDDNRLTRGMTAGFNNFHSRHVWVGELVGSLIEGLADEELARGDEKEDVGGGWLRAVQGYPVRKAAAEAWWAKAQKVGEEAYVLAHVLPEVDKEGLQGQIKTHPFRVIVAKYPKYIPVLYRKVLDGRTDMSTRELLDAIVTSGMPAAEKLALVRRGCEHKDSTQRLQAFESLARLDRKDFATRLVSELDSFPKDLDGPYNEFNEPLFAELAFETDDPRVWATLEKVLKRSVVAFRVYLLRTLGDDSDARQRPERLRLLAQFLDDTTVPDKGSAKLKFGQPYENLAVRDYATVEIAGLLGNKVEVDQKRTPPEWAALRGRVREDLKRELAKDR